MPQGYKNRLIGLAYQQSVLDLLKQGPKTPKQISADLGIVKSSVNKYLMRLHAEPKQIFIAGHMPNHQGMPATLWAAGNSPDVGYIPREIRGKFQGAEARRQKSLEVLRNQPMCTTHLAAAVHLDKTVVQKHIKALRQPDNRQLFIMKWLRTKEVYPDSTGTSWIPVYAVGNLPDKPAPKKESSADRHRRLQKEKDYRDRAKARSKARNIIRNATKKPQGIFAALGL